MRRDKIFKCRVSEIPVRSIRSDFGRTVSADVATEVTLRSLQLSGLFGVFFFVLKCERAVDSAFGSHGVIRSVFVLSFVQMKIFRSYKSIVRFFNDDVSYFSTDLL